IRVQTTPSDYVSQGEHCFKSFFNLNTNPQELP
ncbi:hypothetical protein Y032_1319g3822, partial [Ancylostoma ceylanicum]